MEFGPQHFSSAAEENVKKEHRAATWTVWDRYEVSKTDGGIEYAWVPLSAHHDDCYCPLAHTPGLFLEFAQLADEGEITREVWLDWLKRYGTLGLGNYNPERASFIEDARGIALGGPGESFVNFEREALRANFVLRLYEAVHSTEEKLDESWVVDRLTRLQTTDIYDGRLQIIKPKMPREVRAWALGYVRREVEDQVSECFPTIHLSDAGFVQGWNFYTLLASMYLQMMMLLLAKEEEVRRCARIGCNKVIAFEQPAPPKEDPGFKKNARGKYKTRKDKAYCSDNCRASHHYHQKKALGGR